MSKGNKSWTGRERSEDFKAHMSEVMKGNRHLRGKHFKMPGGMKWWNNGEDEKRLIECPEGWVQGRLPAGTWWTDGTQEVRARKCPRGFWSGRKWSPLINTSRIIQPPSGE